MRSADNGTDYNIVTSVWKSRIGQRIIITTVDRVDSVGQHGIYKARVVDTVAIIFTDKLVIPYSPLQYSIGTEYRQEAGGISSDR